MQRATETCQLSALLGHGSLFYRQEKKQAGDGSAKRNEGSSSGTAIAAKKPNCEDRVQMEFWAWCQKGSGILK